jgi:hypothetical protein
MIEREAGQRKTVITICNYGKYQDAPGETGQSSEQKAGQKPDRNGQIKKKETREQRKPPLAPGDQGSFAERLDTNLTPAAKAIVETGRLACWKLKLGSFATMLPPQAEGWRTGRLLSGRGSRTRTTGGIAMKQGALASVPAQCGQLASGSPAPMAAALAIAELSAILALCAPAAMSDQHREEFLHVAYQTLAHLPQDLFVDAARSARVLQTPGAGGSHIAAHAAERLALRDRLNVGARCVAIADDARMARRTWWQPSPAELAQAKAEVCAAIAAGARPAPTPGN